MNATPKNLECLKYVDTRALTPHEARELNKIGFKTHFVQFVTMDKALYDVYVKLR